jgi:phosphatidylserine/phosphatidylglycerophosphate/cardiolipin synthase-like enzyme
MARRTSSRARPRRASRQQLSGRAILLLIVILIGAYLIDRYVTRLPLPGLETPTAAPPAISGEPVQAFFTTPALVYPDRPANRQPAPIELAIVADIDAARSSVEFATFEFNLASIAEALVRAKERGVNVRAALDQENLDKVEMADFAAQLQRAHIPIAWEESDAFLHSKFIIVDNALVWMGSWNSTINDTYRNNNNLLRITVPQIVQNYAAEFGQMAESTFGNDKEAITPHPRVALGGVTIENYFSPNDGVRQHVVERLRAAQQSIRFLAFSFTADEIKDAMIERERGGVSVQGVFEQRNAGGQGSEFEQLKNVGQVYVDGNCYTMHHKLIIIDDRIVITGSYNFTSRAENDNDENLLIIDDPALAQQYIAEFDRVFQQAQNPTRCG